MVYKKLEELNLIDNFLFEEILNQGEEGKKFCRIILATVLQHDFHNIQITPQRNIPGVYPSTHGIRLDAYIEAEVEEKMESPTNILPEVKISSGIFDIEPNIYRADNEAKRTRYYHSLIDTKILKSGIDYAKLKNVVVIMILPYDPFGKNRMVYTFKTTCVEDNTIPYDDGVTTIYLYTKGTEDNSSQALRDMLKFMEHTTDENATNADLKALQNIVKHVKRDGEVGVRYMKSWEAEAYAREEGKQEGYQSGKIAGVLTGKIEILLEENYSPEEIAAKLHMTEGEVSRIMKVELAK